MRYFLKQLDRHPSVPLISEELWASAKQKTFSTYDGSMALGYVKRCVTLFEQTSGKAKYLSDFREFVFESSVEDFCEISKTDVMVSTIHKAKGREFDDVFMLLSNQPHQDSRLFRQYYVGMTRARNRLFIHTNSGLFDRLRVDRHVVTTQQYPMPEKVVLQLSHRDVNLDFFKYRKKEVLSLRSGDPLDYKNFMLFLPGKETPVALLSQAMQKKMADWQQRGYQVQSAYVRFIVAWKGKDAPKDEMETAVLLPDIEMRREDDDAHQQPAPNCLS